MTDKESQLFTAINALSKLIGGVQIKFFTYRLISTYIDEGLLDSPFCQLVQKSPIGAKMCAQCDKTAQETARRIHSAFTYTCHMGLVEMMHPVFSADTFIGAFLFGQFHSTDSNVEAAFQSITGRLYSLGINLSLAREAYFALPIFTPEKINSIRNVLDLIAYFSITSGIKVEDTSPYFDKIDDYIELHLSDNITLSDIAKHLHLSSAYLSNLFSKKKNVTLSNYIQMKRIKQACLLLKTTDDSINYICYNTGFADQNYFARIFKKFTGTTAKNYRANYELYDSYEFILKI